MICSIELWTDRHACAKGFLCMSRHSRCKCCTMLPLELNYFSQIPYMEWEHLETGDDHVHYLVERLNLNPFKNS